MAPYGKQDLNQDPWFPRNNVADWPLEDRLRFEDLQRREEGILLLKIFVVERISKNTNCICKIWKIIAVGKNMEFHRFRIFEYLNYRIFEFSDYRYRPSKIYYMQNQMINPLLGNPPLAKGKHYIFYNLCFILQGKINCCLQKLIFDKILDDFSRREKGNFGI